MKHKTMLDRTLTNDIQFDGMGLDWLGGDRANVSAGVGRLRLPQYQHPIPGDLILVG